MSGKRKVGRFQITGHLIREALAMPEEAMIYNITRHDWRPDVFVFYIEHPDFPELDEAIAPTDLNPVITADYEKRPSMWLHFDWGLNPVKENEDGDRAQVRDA